MGSTASMISLGIDVSLPHENDSLSRPERDSPQFQVERPSSDWSTTICPCEAKRDQQQHREPMHPNQERHKRRGHTW